jgi:hypothetical protein
MRAELAALGGRGQRWRFALGCVRVVVTRPPVLRRAGFPLLAFGLVFAGYLVGVSALTAQWSRVAGRTLVTGLVAGGAAAMVWTATVLLAPPIPDSAVLAFGLVAVSMAVAAWVADRLGGSLAGSPAAICAGTVAVLLIVDVVAVLSASGPARLIPDLASAALTPADDLAQSRVELMEPYLWLLLPGSLIAVGQCMALLSLRRPAPGTADPGAVRVRLAHDVADRRR